MAISGFISDRYWSSSESGTHIARALNFSDGTQVGTLTKNSGIRVRCVRKGIPALGGACSRPQGIAGEIVYNDDHNIMQYCNGNEWVAMGDFGGSATVLVADVTLPVWSTAAGDTGDVQTNSNINVANIIVTASDDSGSVTYSKVSGDAWLTINSSTGRLEGTSPGASGTATIVARATDPSGNFADRTFTVDIIADTSPPSFGDVSGDFIYVTANQAFSRTLDMNDSSGIPPTASKITGAAWINVASDGTVSGTAPASTGSYTFTVRLTDASGNDSTSDRSFNVVVLAAGPAGCPAIGDECPDGSIYIGNYDYGSGDEYLFVSSYDNAGSGVQWKTSTGANDIATNNEDGRLNVAQVSPISDFPAINLCENLETTAPTHAHTQTDWYLPSQEEFQLIKFGLSAINSNIIDSISNNMHWSSSELDNNEVYTNFPLGDSASRAKTGNARVRCIRRDAPGGSCDTTPTTYNTPGTYTYNVPSGCSSVTIQAYGAGGGGNASGNAGGGGGGGGSVVERTDTTVLAVGGGGGGGGSDRNSGGGGGGYGAATVSVSASEQLNVWVGGGGLPGALVDGSNGGAVSGGAGGAENFAGGDSTYGGGGGSGDDASGGGGGDSVYGGGGGAGKDNGSAGGGSSTYGGGGGGADGSGSGGTSTFGNNGLNGDGAGGGGGGGLGDTTATGGNGQTNGTNGGTAANSGPGNGGNAGANGGNGRVVITPAP